MDRPDTDLRGAGAAPSDHTTLTEVLGQFAAAGFGGEFEVADGGATVRCLTCDAESPAADLSQHTLRRLEGASDPADMAVVAAVACPRCGAGGTMVLPYGPNASAADALVLAALRDGRAGAGTPRNSAPGETIGDDGRDVMPGEQAPPFTAPASTGKDLALDDFLGKVPVALTFAGTLSAEATDEVVESFARAFPNFGQQRVQSLLVVPESTESIRRRRSAGTKVPMLADADGRLMEMYAASGTFPATVLIDEGGKVTRVVEGGVASDHAAAVLRIAQDSSDASHRSSTS